LFIFDNALRANSYPFYDQLRAADPIHWHPDFGVWMLTRYADVSAALRDSRLGSLKELEAQGLAESLPVLRIISDMMLFSNPPKHTRIRALVRSALNSQVIASLTDFVQEIVDTLIDRIERRRHVAMSAGGDGQRHTGLATLRVTYEPAFVPNGRSSP
jgi:cytochrome P450